MNGANWSQREKCRDGYVQGSNCNEYIFLCDHVILMKRDKLTRNYSKDTCTLTTNNIHMDTVSMFILFVA